MSSAARRAAAAAGLLVTAALGAATIAPPAGAAPRPDPIAAALADAKPASKPFASLTETEVRVGRTTLDVVLADESDERHQGLRERRTIGEYDGMLFVFDGQTFTAFTMSTVPVPLDIGFYDERGRVVDRLRMKPCPDAESGCPTYAPSGDFTYALETLAGDLPRGRLRDPG